MGQGADLTGRVRRARRVRVTHDAEASSCAETSVGGLRPRRARVEREVDAGRAHTCGEGTGVVGPRVARLQVDIVVRAGYQDAGVVRVDGERRLVLLVLRKRRYGTADGNPSIRVEGCSESDEQAGSQRNRGPDREEFLHVSPPLDFAFGLSFRD